MFYKQKIPGKNLTRVGRLTVRSVMVLVLLVTGDTPVPGVGQSVVVLVHHGEPLPGAEVEILPRETVLQ